MEKIIETIVFNEQKEMFQLVYYLVKNGDYFGVFAQKITDGLIADFDYINFLFKEREKVLNVINILAENTVTPFSMAEIIDELY